MGTITHSFVSAIADDVSAAAAGEVVPSNWNANHTILLTTGDLTGWGTGVSAAVLLPVIGTGGIVLSSAAGITSAAVALIYAPINSPLFTGVPAGPTPTFGDSSTKLATTAFVSAALAAGGGAGITSAAVALIYAPLNSPALIGTPTAPTLTAGTSNTGIATTAFVSAAILAGNTGITSAAVALKYVPINGPLGTPSSGTLTNATGLPIGGITGLGTGVGAALAANVTGSGGIVLATGPTIGAPIITGQLTYGGVLLAPSVSGLGSMALTSAPVLNAPTITGALTYGGVTLAAAVSGTGAMTLVSSPAFTGTPTAPTLAAGDSSTGLATTAFVSAALASGAAGITSAAVAAKYAPLNSPVFITPTLGVATATSVAADVFTVTTNNVNLITAAAYTVQNTDNGKLLKFSSVTATAVSVNTGLTAGLWFEAEAFTSAQVTLSGTATLHSSNGLKTRTQYSVLRVRYEGVADTYNVSGDSTT